MSGCMFGLASGSLSLQLEIKGTRQEKFMFEVESKGKSLIWEGMHSPWLKTWQQSSPETASSLLSLFQKCSLCWTIDDYLTSNQICAVSCDANKYEYITNTDIKRKHTTGFFFFVVVVVFATQSLQHRLTVVETEITLISASKFWSMYCTFMWVRASRQKWSLRYKEIPHSITWTCSPHLFILNKCLGFFFRLLVSLYFGKQNQLHMLDKCSGTNLSLRLITNSTVVGEIKELSEPEFTDCADSAAISTFVGFFFSHYIPMFLGTSI